MMRKIIKTGLGLLVIILVISGCIDKIDLKPGDPVVRLVIHGSIENYDKPYEVDINLTGDFDGDVREPVNSARVFLRDIAGDENELFNVAPGRYESLPDASIVGEIGGQYQLVVEYEGSTYESTIETILPSVPLDSVTYVTERSQFRNDQGVTSTKEEFILFTHFNIQEDDTWLRWEVENTFGIGEIFCGPFDPVRFCYVPLEEYASREVALWDGNVSVQNTPITSILQRRDIDIIYGMPQYFNVYQKRIDKASYDYWSQLNKLLIDDESIFSIPPASVSGNISNVDDPSEIVLGIFEAVSVDTVNVFTLPQFLQLGRTLNGICGVPGFRPRPLPTECCDCLVLPNSTLEKPEWWN